jgi:hypothetical protein
MKGGINKLVRNIVATKGSGEFEKVRLTPLKVFIIVL